MANPAYVVETFVDPGQFCGTLYTASAWEKLCPADRRGRCQRNAQVKPRKFFVRELCRNGGCSLQAEHLKPALAL
jgi:hypothetical protein